MSPAELKAFVLFADLSDEEREEVSQLLEARQLSPGETLFHEGDDADALVLVLQGRIDVSSRRTAATAQLGGGAALGALSLFAVGPREVTAVGGERSEVRLLRREDFLRFAEDSPRAALRIASALAAETAAAARAALASARAVG